MYFVQTTTIDYSREMTQNFEISSHLSYTIRKISQLLQVDSSLILRFKYHPRAILNKSKATHTSQNFPCADVELVAQWLKDIDINGNLPRHSFKLTDSLLCQKAWHCAEQKNKPLLINKKSDLLKITNSVDPSLILKPESTVAMLVVPLLSHQSGNLPSVLGFMIFQQNQPRVWNNSDIDLAQWAATQASLAIIHNETLAVVQSLNDERKAQSRFTSELQNMLFQKRGETIEELRRTNEIKDQFIARLSDELKNPLTIMKAAINNLKIMFNNGMAQPKFERALNILETECTKEISLVNKLLTLQQLKSHQITLQIQKLDLKPIIQDLIGSFTEQWASKGIIYTLKDDSLIEQSHIYINSDYEKTKEIIGEIMQNAGKFSQPNNSVEVNLSAYTQEEQKFIKIDVKNIGPGISPEEQKQIFEAFFQGSNVPHASNRGMGIGLTMVKYLVELIKGTVEVSSIPLADTSLSQTSVSVSLPQYP